VQQNHADGPHIHRVVQLEDVSDQRPFGSSTLLALLRERAALENLGRQEYQVLLPYLILIEVQMAHVLYLYQAILVKEDVLHAQHAFEAAVETSEVSLAASSAQVVEGLQDLEARLDKELLTEIRLLRLARAIEIEEREVVGFADDIDAILDLRVAPILRPLQFTQMIALVWT